MKMAVDRLMDLVLSIVARLKEDHYAELTFDELLKCANGLSGECSSAVAGYNCCVVTDRDSAGFKVGIFPLDAERNTFGGEDVVMKVVRADKLDEKLLSLIDDGREGTFFIPAK